MRLYVLARAFWRTLLSEGAAGSVTRLVKYLRGERRYQHQKPAIYPPAETSERYLFYPFTDAEYAAHVRLTEPTITALDAQTQRAAGWPERPLLSVVTAVYRPPLAIFQETLKSVQMQTYAHWQWCVVDASPDDTIWHYLTQEFITDPRIKPIRAPENRGISGNTNLGLAAASGDYIVLLDHDDTLSPDALYEVASAARLDTSPDLIYSDEDKLDENGCRCELLLKPDWSPEMMLCANLITHLAAFKRSLLDVIGPLNPETDGAQDWDLFFRIAETTPNIHHIPKVLYHWRKSSFSTAQSRDNKSGVQFVQQSVILNHLKRTGLQNPRVDFLDDHPINSVYPLSQWEQKQPRRISVIMKASSPYPNAMNAIKRCLDSLFTRTIYADYEVILLCTDDTLPALQALYKGKHRLKFVQIPQMTRLPVAYNLGAEQASGDLLVFLDYSVEIIQANWLDLMAQWFEREGVGIVAPKMIYPDGTIHHAGRILRMGKIADSLFADQPENLTSIFGSDCWYRNLSIVTGNCLMISRTLFDDVGRFDEDYSSGFIDVDLCLQVRQHGRRIVYTPHVRLIYHYEGAKPVPHDDGTIFAKWTMEFLAGDPFFNPNLNPHMTYPTLRVD